VGASGARIRREDRPPAISLRRSQEGRGSHLVATPVLSSLKARTRREGSQVCHVQKEKRGNLTPKRGEGNRFSSHERVRESSESSESVYILFPLPIRRSERGGSSRCGACSFLIESADTKGEGGDQVGISPRDAQRDLALQERGPGGRVIALRFHEGRRMVVFLMGKRGGLERACGPRVTDAPTRCASRGISHVAIAASFPLFVSRTEEDNLEGVRCVMFRKRREGT